MLRKYSDYARGNINKKTYGDKLDVLGLHHGVELRSRHVVRLLTLLNLRSNIEDGLRHLLHGRGFFLAQLLLLDLANFSGVHALHLFIRGLGGVREASLLACTSSNDQEAAEAAAKSQEEGSECGENEENNAGVHTSDSTSSFDSSGLESNVESFALLDG
jgi:hypothetical protein